MVAFTTVAHTTSATAGAGKRRARGQAAEGRRQRRGRGGRASDAAECRSRGVPKPRSACPRGRGRRRKAVGRAEGGGKHKQTAAPLRTDYRTDDTTEMDGRGEPQIYRGTTLPRHNTGYMRA